MIPESVNLIDELIAEKFRKIEMYRSLEIIIPEAQKVLYFEQLILYQDIAKLERRKQLMISFVTPTS